MDDKEKLEGGGDADAGVGEVEVEGEGDVAAEDEDDDEAGEEELRPVMRPEESLVEGGAEEGEADDENECVSAHLREGQPHVPILQTHKREWSDCSF